MIPIIEPLSTALVKLFRGQSHNCGSAKRRFCNTGNVRVQARRHGAREGRADHQRHARRRGRRDCQRRRIRAQDRPEGVPRRPLRAHAGRQGRQVESQGARIEGRPVRVGGDRALPEARIQRRGGADGDVPRGRGHTQGGRHRPAAVGRARGERGRPRRHRRRHGGPARGHRGRRGHARGRGRLGAVLPKHDRTRVEGASDWWSATGAPDSSPRSTRCRRTRDASGAWRVSCATCSPRRRPVTGNGRPPP